MRYLIITIVLIIMGFSNPNTSEFSSFISSHIKNEMLKDSETKETSNLSTGIASLFAKSIAIEIGKSVDRTNFIFVSTYFLDMSIFRDFGAETKDIRMLGIFGTFIPI
ncbi:MAG: DUF4359 domain-containing protein [Gammaproteobacteria bacterium]|jgi:hypothetical protein|nr:DUF4359 domain-containing protein [Gammaproteobacteria bacterium]